MVNDDDWLLVSTYPSEKILVKSVGVMKFPTEWKVINSMVPNHQLDVSFETYGGDLGIPILENLLKRFLNVAFDQQTRGRTLCQPEGQILTSFGRPTGLF